jgi:hypothetical protein
MPKHSSPNVLAAGFVAATTTSEPVSETRAVSANVEPCSNQKCFAGTCSPKHSNLSVRQNIFPQLHSRANHFGVVEFGDQLFWERIWVFKRRDEFSLSDELGVPPHVLVAGQLTVESALGLKKLLFPTHVGNWPCNGKLSLLSAFLFRRWAVQTKQLLVCAHTNSAQHKSRRACVTVQAPYETEPWFSVVINNNNIVPAHGLRQYTRERTINDTDES